MDKHYKPAEVEGKIYSLWEKGGYFSAPNAKKPYTIIMPPPNANASLHAGHAMYTIDDILIRFKRMQGFSALWIPGTDHAGFETQFVYEKYLKKQGKSRMDFDRKTLYQDIYDFVKENSGLIFKQFTRLGFSADWKRSVFTLEDKVIQQVFKTFKKMYDEGYIKRDEYIVNYCTYCGTSLADLEVVHIERTDPLFYVRYPVKGKKDFITVATVRPEPIFVDTHLAVNPKDKKRNHLIGQTVLNPLTDAEMQIIGDEYVDPEFGTGIVKLTPAHDPNDFKVAKKHNLPITTAIDWNGRIVKEGGKYAGLKVKQAREAVVLDLKEKGLIEKIDENYLHSLATCYKCGRDLEPLTIPNWFIKVEKLKEKVKKATTDNKVKFIPHKFKSHMLSWLEIMHDWPISRQIVWGIRIPIWYEVDPKASNIWVWFIDKDKKPHQDNLRKFLDQGIKIEEIEQGLQKVHALTGPSGPKYVISDKKPTDGKMYLPETDTFDTWFSSGQWPLIVLNKDEMKSRYPTDVMGTLSDILKLWVSRMIMFGLYLESEVPFKEVFLWSMVADKFGKKMSKSKGNVVNPIEMIDKYGADALRMSLVYGIPAGGKVILSDDKVRGMRNFANKLWNVARFVEMEKEKVKTESLHKDDKWILAELNTTIKTVTDSLEKYKFNEASETIYEFIWHKFADIYIEKTKSRRKEAQQTLEHVLDESLKLLHPFMPFVTEEIWGKLNKDKPLIITSWPTI
ncbi:valine--tRNA ligase [Candidatus Gottesmanbacteria bacterium]|nr:valine--tRNA ligase [Candidatus Gottesmanbacteria bacterium]